LAIAINKISLSKLSAFVEFMAEKALSRKKHSFEVSVEFYSKIKN
jgi:hypothetical protein